MKDLSLKNYAHLGDAVWELIVREKTVFLTQKIKELHKLTIERVNASYQAELLRNMENFLNEEELDIIRRARNLQVPVSRRTQQAEYRQATAFEALVGWLYLNNKERLNELLSMDEIL